MTTVIVKMQHIRAANLCSSGSREWFAKYGFSWQDFLENGISADALIATGDAFALRVVEIAKKEQR